MSQTVNIKAKKPVNQTERRAKRTAQLVARKLINPPRQIGAKLGKDFLREMVFDELIQTAALDLETRTQTAQAGGEEEALEACKVQASWEAALRRFRME